MKSHVPQFLGTVTSSVSAIAAWQEHVDWLLRVGASGVAIIAGALTIISLVRKYLKEKHEHKTDGLD